LAGSFNAKGFLRVELQAKASKALANTV
jgi:hypothetical protein